MMMKQRQNEKGFISVTVVLLLVFVFGIMVVIFGSRSAFISNDFHREFVQKQAYYLAKGAMEEAMLQVQNQKELQEIPKAFPIKVSPLFVGNDPLKGDEPGSLRIYDATCSYTIETMDTFSSKMIPPGNPVYLLTAKTEINFRQTVLREKICSACYKNEKNEWVKFPVR